VKWISNQASHGFWAWAEDLRGRQGPRRWNEMGKRWRAGHSGVYSPVVEQAKWKFRYTPGFDWSDPRNLLRAVENYPKLAQQAI